MHCSCVLYGFENSMVWHMISVNTQCKSKTCKIELQNRNVLDCDRIYICFKRYLSYNAQTAHDGEAYELSCMHIILFRMQSGFC